MNDSTLTVRISSDLKEELEDICNQIGITPSAAINIFIKTLVRDRKFPFELEAPDPFYSKSNIEFLLKSIQEFNQGKFQKHELVEDYDE